MGEESSILGVPGQTTATTFWAKLAANGLSWCGETDETYGEERGLSAKWLST